MIGGVLGRMAGRWARGIIRYRFSTAEQIDFDQVGKRFQMERDMDVFGDLIKASNNTVDNINYFKIYKFLADNKAEIKHFQDFYREVSSTLAKKSDSIRMLLANVKSHIAKQHAKAQNYYDASNCLEEALQVLQSSLIPPVLLYYQIYRYYGFMQDKIGNLKQALEALKESVEIIQKFVEHSDDVVQSDHNTKNQAIAYYLLAKLQPEDGKKWVDKCFKSWNQFEGNKYQLKQYADSIIAKVKQGIPESRQKANQFMTVSMYQFKDGELKDYLKRHKQELFSKQN